jgi:hypothetical protein
MPEALYRASSGNYYSGGWSIWTSSENSSQEAKYGHMGGCSYMKKNKSEGLSVRLIKDIK